MNKLILILITIATLAPDFAIAKGWVFIRHHSPLEFTVCTPVNNGTSTSEGFQEYIIRKNRSVGLPCQGKANLLTCEDPRNRMFTTFYWFDNRKDCQKTLEAEYNAYTEEGKN